MTKPRRSTCPRCHASDAIPIVFGLPEPELQAKAKRGEVQLGGCLVGGAEPDWHCPSCGHEWCTSGEERPPLEAPGGADREAD